MKTIAFAAPSCVIPGTVAENAHFLAGRVTEVALCFFETQPCLAYGVEDLPMNLKELDLSWHVHLPVDLPWEAGGRAAAAMALALMGKVAYLSPRLAVLHPPQSPQAHTLLRDFAHLWRQHTEQPLLLENIDTAPLVDMQELIIEARFGICLDVAHALGYGQDALLNNGVLLQKVALVHWSAPGQQDQHLPLTALTPDEWHTARNVARQLPADAHHVLEIFHWNGVEVSAPLLHQLLHDVPHV